MSDCSAKCSAAALQLQLCIYSASHCQLCCASMNCIKCTRMRTGVTAPMASVMLTALVSAHAGVLQAVVRYAGGVLNEMQDLWMHQKLLRDPCRRQNRTRSLNSAAPGHSRSSGTNITSATPISGGPTSTADPDSCFHAQSTSRPSTGGYFHEANFAKLSAAWLIIFQAQLYTCADVALCGTVPASTLRSSCMTCTCYRLHVFRW